HALGVLAEDALAVGLEADLFDQLLGLGLARGRGHVEEPAVEVERLLGVEEAVQVRLLGQVADALVLADVGGGLADEEGIALGGEEQAEQQLDRGGLAGAVGPEQAEDLAAADLDVEGPQGGLLLAAPEVAVDLGELSRFNDYVLGHEATSQEQGTRGAPGP